MAPELQFDHFRRIFKKICYYKLMSPFSNKKKCVVGGRVCVYSFHSFYSFIKQQSGCLLDFKSNNKATRVPFFSKRVKDENGVLMKHGTWEGAS